MNTLTKERIFFTLFVIVIALSLSSILLSIIYPAIPEYNHITCNSLNPGYCVEINLTAYVAISARKSNYQYPYYSLGDVILIDSIKIVNLGSSNTGSFPKTLLLEASPNDPSNGHIPIRSNISLGDTYLIERNQKGRYCHTLNDKQLGNCTSHAPYRIPLDEIGTWEINFNLDDVSYDSIINGIYTSNYNFYARPLSELESINISKIAALIAGLTIIITLFSQLIIFYWSNSEETAKKENQLQIQAESLKTLKKINTSIDELYEIFSKND